MRLLPLKQSNLVIKKFEKPIIKLFKKNSCSTIFFEVKIEPTSILKNKSKKMFYSVKKCVFLNVFLNNTNKDFSLFAENTKITLTKKIIYSF